MKKLLVLALVLGMASLANATLVMSFDAGTSLVTVSTDAALGQGYNQLFAVVTDVGTLSDALVLNPPFNGSTYVGNIDTLIASDWGGFPAGKAGYAGNILVDTSTAIAAGTALFTMKYAGPQTTAELVLGDENFNYTGVASTVVVGVPEPATLAVLGLGALMLRRKK